MMKSKLLTKKTFSNQSRNMIDLILKKRFLFINDEIVEKKHRFVLYQ